MYKPEYDVPLSVALSLAVSLITFYVTCNNLLGLKRSIDGVPISPENAEYERSPASSVDIAACRISTDNPGES